MEVDVLSSWTWNVILMRNIVGETWGDESGTSGRQVVLLTVVTDCLVLSGCVVRTYVQGKGE